MGGEILLDDPKSGTPSAATANDNVDKTHDMVMGDRRLATRHMGNTTGRTLS